MSRAKDPDPSRFRPNLHSRAESLSLETLGATMQIGSESRCVGILGATHVQTFKTLCPVFADSNSRRDYGEQAYIPSHSITRMAKHNRHAVHNHDSKDLEYDMTSQKRT